MKKRILSILLTLCMVLMLFPATASAEEPAGTITINAPDEVCAQQDCEFTVTASEGVTLDECQGKLSVTDSGKQVKIWYLSFGMTTVGTTPYTVTAVGGTTVTETIDILCK